MKNVYLCAIFLLSLCWASVTTGAIYVKPANSRGDTVYVSSEGDDKQGCGTVIKPFYSLNKAVEGRLSVNEFMDTLFVMVAPGDYFMQESFSIQNPSSRPIVIKAQTSEKPRFLGGISITGWKKCTTGLYKADIPEVVRYGLGFEQFYVNAQRAILARTPNVEWFYVKDSKEHVFVKGSNTANYAVQQIDFRKSDWITLFNVPINDLNHLKFRFYHKWDITRKKPKYVEADSARIYMDGLGMKPWNLIQKGSRYFMYDYKAALDSPGEWYLDREKGCVYYMQRDGENIDSVFCVAPVLRQLIVIKGEKGKPVKNITFKDLSFQYSSYMIPTRGEEPM